jgi:hypothetical protein
MVTMPKHTRSRERDISIRQIPTVLIVQQNQYINQTEIGTAPLGLIFVMTGDNRKK